MKKSLIVIPLCLLLLTTGSLKTYAKNTNNINKKEDSSLFLEVSSQTTKATNYDSHELLLADSMYAVIGKVKNISSDPKDKLVITNFELDISEIIKGELPVDILPTAKAGGFISD